jgi:hypothetical protein
LKPIHLKNVTVTLNGRYKILSIDGTAVSGSGSPNTNFKTTFRLECIDGFERLPKHSTWGIMLRNGRVYHVETRDNEVLYKAYNQWCGLAMEVN